MLGKRVMAPGGGAQFAEQHVLHAIRALAGWTATDANNVRPSQPGLDILARRVDGCELRISVKSVSANAIRHDYGIGRSFDKHPADVHAFVDLTASSPTVYLAGARTVLHLALERHREYQAARGRPVESLNTWSPKISRRLLADVGARECWSVLEQPIPYEYPMITEGMLARARADAPSPRL